MLEVESIEVDDPFADIMHTELVRITERRTVLSDGIARMKGELRKLNERERQILKLLGIAPKPSGPRPQINGSGPEFGPKGLRMRAWKVKPTKCFLSKYDKKKSSKMGSRGLCVAHYSRWRSNTLTDAENADYDAALDAWREEGKMY